jgi:hypothetical protein
VIPVMGTPEMQITSPVIGGIPKPETRGTEHGEAVRGVFGEIIMRKR